MLAYISDLCDEAGLPDPNTYQLGCRPRCGADHWLSSDPDTFAINLKRGWPWVGPTYYDYLQWLHEQHALSRLADIRWVVAPPLDDHDPREISRFWGSADASRWYTPPLFAYGDRKLSAAPGNETFGAWLIASTACYGAMWDFMAASGPLNSNLYPHSERASLDALIKHAFEALRRDLRERSDQLWLP